MVVSVCCARRSASARHTARDLLDDLVRDVDVECSVEENHSVCALLHLIIQKMARRFIAEVVGFTEPHDAVSGRSSGGVVQACHLRRNVYGDARIDSCSDLEMPILSSSGTS